MNKKLVALVALISCTSTVVSAVSCQLLAGFGAGVIALAGAYYASAREVVKLSKEGSTALLIERSYRGTTQKSIIDFANQALRDQAMMNPKKLLTKLRNNKNQQQVTLSDIGKVRPLTENDINQLRKARAEFLKRFL